MHMIRRPITIVVGILLVAGLIGLFKGPNHLRDKLARQGIHLQPLRSPSPMLPGYDFSSAAGYYRVTDQEIDQLSKALVQQGFVQMGPWRPGSMVRAGQLEFRSFIRRIGFLRSSQDVAIVVRAENSCELIVDPDPGREPYK